MKNNSQRRHTVLLGALLTSVVLGGLITGCTAPTGDEASAQTDVGQSLNTNFDTNIQDPSPGQQIGSRPFARGLVIRTYRQLAGDTLTLSVRIQHQEAPLNERPIANLFIPIERNADGSGSARPVFGIDPLFLSQTKTHLATKDDNIAAEFIKDTMASTLQEPSATAATASAGGIGIQGCASKLEGIANTTTGVIIAGFMLAALVGSAWVGVVAYPLWGIAGGAGIVAVSSRYWGSMVTGDTVC